MKRIITLVILVCMLLSCVAYAEIWYCPNCGQANDSNYCSYDGQRKPSGNSSYSSNVTIGSKINLGSYEQDNIFSNGKESIEWIVLTVQGGRALVVSRYALDCKPYNNSRASVTWDNCSIRNWLNNTFYYDAFTTYERNAILSVSNNGGYNPDHNSDPGYASNDKVFLLSVSEYQNYCSGSVGKAVPTEYAQARGANKESNGHCWYWLRTSGANNTLICYIKSNGVLKTYGCSVSSEYGAIRPAMWVDINSIN